jgi:CRISPR-associated protein Cas4
MEYPGDNVMVHPSLILLLACAGCIFLIISVILKIGTSKIKHHYQIPKGNIVYEDLNKPARILSSRKYPLVGKPDYIMKQRQFFIPIEVKTGDHKVPRHHHIMQLASYCQLVSEEYQCTVPYGILVYCDTKKQIPVYFDMNRKRQLFQTFDGMNKMVQENDPLKYIKDNIDEKKCRNCSMKTYCPISK